MLVSDLVRMQRTASRIVNEFDYSPVSNGLARSGTAGTLQVLQIPRHVFVDLLLVLKSVVQEPNGVAAPKQQNRDYERPPGPLSDQFVQIHQVSRIESSLRDPRTGPMALTALAYGRSLAAPSAPSLVMLGFLITL